MPISMSCPSCGKQLSAPDSSSGKKAKCPSCGQIMIVPEVVQEAEEFGLQSSVPSPPSGPESSPPPAGNWLDQVQGAEVDPTSTGAGGEERRPCRECGEMIVVGAAKCRFCGAVFDSRLRGSRGSSLRSGGQSYQGFAITSMVLGILALFTACFGIVFGIVAVIFAVVANNGMNKSKNYEGKGMATAGMVTGILGAVGWTIIYLCIFMFAFGGGVPRHHF